MPTIINGLMVFGSLSAPVTYHQMSNLSDGADIELHLLRHFQTISGMYAERLVGRKYEAFNRDTGVYEDRVVSYADIAHALETPGSKFLPGIERLDNPYELMMLVRAEAMNRAADGILAWFDEGFAYKTYFTVEFGYRIGFTGVAELDALSPHERECVVQEKRGKLQGDDLIVNIISGYQGSLVSSLAVVIGMIKGASETSPGIFTAYPGTLDPSLPRDNQGQEEREYCRAYWAARAFIG